MRIQPIRGLCEVLIEIDESRRLDALAASGVLESESDPALEQLIAFAARYFDSPITLLSLVTRDKQIFKVKVGLSVDHTSRAVSFCTHAIQQTGVFVVEDATTDKRFSESELVTGDPHIRFYAGAPVVVGVDRQPVGTVCVIDRVPRQLTQGDLRVLEAIAVCVGLLIDGSTRPMQVQSAVEDCPKGLALCNWPNLDVVATSRRFSERFGQWHTDHRPLDITQILNLGAGTAVASVLLAAIRSFRFEALTSLLRLASGEVVQCHVVCLPIRNPLQSERKIGFLIIPCSTDSAEEFLASLPRTVRQSLVAQSIDGFWKTDPDFHVCHASGLLSTDLAQRSASAATPRFWALSIFDRPSAKSTLASIERAMRLKQPFGPLDLEIDTIDSTHWVSLRGLPIVDGEAGFLGYAGTVRDITPRKHREAQLSLLSSALSNVKDVVIITDAAPIDEPGPVIVWVNDAFAERTGYSHAEAIGRSPRFLQCPGTSRDELDRLRTSLAAWAPFRGELLNQTKDGTPIWIEIDISPVSLDGGPLFTHWVSVQRDITSRRMMESALQAARRTAEDRSELLEQTLQSISQGIIKFGSDDRVVLFNDKALELLEISNDVLKQGAHSDSIISFLNKRGDLLGASIIDDAHKKPAPKDPGLSTSRHHIYRRRTLSGRVLEVGLLPLPDGSRIRTFTDVTELAELATEKSQESSILQSVFRTIPDRVWFKTLDHRYRFCNPIFEQQVGISRDAIIGMSDSELFGPELARRFVDSDRNVLRMNTERYDHAEWVLDRASDTQRLIQITKVLVKSEEGTPIGFLGFGRDVTAQFEAEQSLTQLRDILTIRNNRLEDTLANISQGVVKLDVEGTVEFVSDKALELLELPGDVLRVGATLQEIAHFQANRGDFSLNAESMDEVTLSYLKRASDGMPLLNPPLRYMRRNRNGVALDIQTSRTRDGGWIRTYSDVTVLIEAMRIASDSEARLRAFIWGSPDRVWMKDAKGAYIACNKANLDFHGLPYEAMIGKTDREIFDTASAEEFVAFDNKARNATSAITVERLLRGGDGQQRLLSVTKVGIQDANGTWLGTVGVARDITEQKTLEDRLWENNQLLERLSDRLPGVLYRFERELNQEYRFTFLSNNFERLTGLNRETVLKDPRVYFKTVQPDDLQQAFQLTAASEAEGSNWAFEYRTKTQGGWRWWRALSSISYSDQRRPIWHGFMSDIHDIKETQLALEAAVETATDASYAKTAFLASMSHELRTPMNSVLGYAQLLDYDGFLTTEQAEYVKQIRVASEHLLRLIDQVLDIGRIESRRLDVQLEMVALRPMVAEICDLLRPSADSFAVETINLVDDGIEVRGDRHRLKQVLLNLIANAIKYNRPNGQVEIRAEIQATGWVRTEVADQGPGISESSFGRLFQPFERLGKENGSIEGTGIGLYLCKQLITLMGGTIGVDSSDEGGSSFWVLLPRFVDEARLPDSRR